MKQLDIRNRAEFGTAGALVRLLNNLRDDTPAYVHCENGWLQMSEDFSFACLDYYDPDEYDTETFEGMIDTLNWFDTVGELRSLLRWLPDDLPVFVCDLYGWFHTPDDYSYISVFGDELNDYYEEAQNEL